MFRKEINSRSIIYKTFFFYLCIYFCAIVLKYSNVIDFLLIDIEYKYLIPFNIVSISFGLPLSIIFDLLLIKLFGLIYILFFAPIVALLGLIQVLFMRKANINFSKNKVFKKYIKNYQLYKFLKSITFNPIFIFILRTFPILPFALSSYIIAKSRIHKKWIFIHSLFGSYIYYFSLYLIVKIS